MQGISNKCVASIFLLAMIPRIRRAAAYLNLRQESPTWSFVFVIAPDLPIKPPPTELSRR